MSEAKNIDANVIWSPFPGSQVAFLDSTPVTEVLFEGTRGGGKTDCLIMSFLMHVGKGYGSDWTGVLFRQNYKQLGDVVKKSKKWIPKIFPDAKFYSSNSDYKWVFAGGEQLLFRSFASPRDYENYHGHEYPWIGWEELTNWAMDTCYKSMFSTSRSSGKGMPRMIRATTNPYGPGHNWVKERFGLPSMRGVVRRGLVDNQGWKEPPRLVLFSKLEENEKLMENDPDYADRLAASARNDAQRKAWLEGTWDIVAGGMFDDVWIPEYNVVRPFSIPRNWRIDRSFDWGSSKPFSVGWWAESNGEDMRLADGTYMNTVKGDLFRIGEWYGYTGKSNEGLRMLATDISKGIIEKEIDLGLRSRDEDYCLVKTGVADSSIFNTENGNCIANDMAKPIRLDGGVQHSGIRWNAADKRPGSRVGGWDMMRRMIKNASPNEFGPRELPGFFVFDTCDSFLRTVPVLPRCDKNQDDINTEAEDHIADESRYRVRNTGNNVTSGRYVGF